MTLFEELLDVFGGRATSTYHKRRGMVGSERVDERGLKDVFGGRATSTYERGVMRGGVMRKGWCVGEQHGLIRMSHLFQRDLLPPTMARWKASWRKCPTPRWGKDPWDNHEEHFLSQKWYPVYGTMKEEIEGSISAIAYIMKKLCIIE